MDRAATGNGLMGLGSSSHIPCQKRKPALAEVAEIGFIQARPAYPEKSACGDFDEVFQRGNAGERTFTNDNTPASPSSIRPRSRLFAKECKTEALGVAGDRNPINADAPPRSAHAVDLSL